MSYFHRGVEVPPWDIIKYENIEKGILINNVPFSLNFLSDCRKAILEDKKFGDWGDEKNDKLFFITPNSAYAWRIQPQRRGSRNRRQITTTLDSETYELLQKICLAENLPFSRIIDKSVKIYFDNINK